MNVHTTIIYILTFKLFSIFFLHVIFCCIHGKRNLHAGQWTLHRTQYKGNVKDAHNVISMML
ncbi:MAG: BNR-4 repeat-containing protein, partial [Lachnoanaerobaculum sp.]|uniref:BNR-4 repeat-containing protein n=1 Tax=Lachnoanaerobaculum sp. TaxID=2049030 RepID=UPI0030702E64|nr:BNR-4 repeat-containing protein [Lachnoanaerobaculum sp.]